MYERNTKNMIRVAAGLTLAVMLAVGGPAEAVPVLYGLVNFAGTGGAEGTGGGSGGGADANLVIINQTDGSIATVGSTGFKRASGLATHPTTGELFATGINTDPATGETDRSVLFTVNRDTGMGTEVGETGIEDDPIDEFNVAGLAFRADGTLFGYFESGDTPGTIDTVTGAATGLTAFTSGVSCCGNGITFVNGDLFHANEGELGELDQITGLQTPIIDLDYTSPFFDAEDGDLTPRVAAMDVHPITGDIYASIIIGFNGNTPGPTAYLAILDPATGTFNYLGASDAKVDAIAFVDVSASVPEPTTLLLLGIGLAGLGFTRRRLH